MQILAPSYYTKFKCIADRCTHSCCVGWEIDVDADTLEKYSALQGETGECIRASLVQEGGGTHFALCADGRCPHLDGRGLCRIITALGEGYLCEICREHPRFYNEVAGHVECGLGLSCEEAARLCLQEDGYDKFILLSGTENGETGGTLQEFCTLPWREELYALLRDRSYPYAARRAEIAARYAAPITLDTVEKKRLFASLEYLDPSHVATLAKAFAQCEPQEAYALFCERFLAYLIYRHASTAQSERERRIALSLALLLEEIFSALLSQKQLSPVQAAVLLSEELEYSEENTEALRFALEMKWI